MFVTAFFTIAVVTNSEADDPQALPTVPISIAFGDCSPDAILQATWAIDALSKGDMSAATVRDLQRQDRREHSDDDIIQSPEFIYMQGLCQFQHAQYDLSIATFNRLSSAEPGSFDDHYNPLVFSPYPENVVFYRALAEERLHRLTDADKDISAVFGLSDDFNTLDFEPPSPQWRKRMRDLFDLLPATKRRIHDASRTAELAHEQQLPPVERCSAMVVRKTYAGMTRDGSVEAALAHGDFGQDVADCLWEARYYVEARTVLLTLARKMASSEYGRDKVYHQLALIEEKLGLHQQAVTHIKEAYVAAGRNYDPNAAVPLEVRDALDKDYRRINRQGVLKANLLNSRQSQEYWSGLSSDERSVVSREGGTRTNAQGHPCHYETFDAPNYHQEVWWYGDCLDGPYTSAYTFVNHRLTSTYSP